MRQLGIVIKNSLDAGGASFVKRDSENEQKLGVELDHAVRAAAFSKNPKKKEGKMRRI